MDTFIPCSIKVLPDELQLEAAKNAIAVNPLNAPSVAMLRQAAPGAVIEPLHLALLTSKYWGNSGVRLTVGFMDNPEAALKTRILSHMNAWGACCNVVFAETATNPQVRISRTPGGGYWSYLGTDILRVPANQPTMNLDSFSMNTRDSEFYRVIRHETGHTLGFPHEHMRKEIVDRIDANKAIAYFGGAPNRWSPDMVRQQVLTPLPSSALLASAQADINSIMCYSLPGSIMKDGVGVPGGTDIDGQDAQFAGSVYPITGVAFKLLVHLQSTGDVVVDNNQFAGTRGQSKRLEGFQLNITPAVQGLSCRYMSHEQGLGDTAWVNEGQFVGTRGQSRRLEGFAIELTGPAAANYTVQYMAHLQGTGDTGVFSNGQFCGTRGQSRRVEGMLVRIQRK